MSDSHPTLPPKGEKAGLQDRRSIPRAPEVTLLLNAVHALVELVLKKSRNLNDEMRMEFEGHLETIGLYISAPTYTRGEESDETWPTTED